MQQIRKPTKYKSAQKLNAFVSVILNWCAIADVKITFLDDPEIDINEIQELLDDSAGMELLTKRPGKFDVEEIKDLLSDCSES